jgi:hypothetical protein
MTVIWAWVMALTFYQQLILIGVFSIIGICVIVVILLLAIRILDALTKIVDAANIKSVSLKGVECYPDDKPVKKTSRRVAK